MTHTTPYRTHVAQLMVMSSLNWLQVHLRYRHGHNVLLCSQEETRVGNPGLTMSTHYLSDYESLDASFPHKNRATLKHGLIFNPSGGFHSQVVLSHEYQITRGVIYIHCICTKRGQKGAYTTSLAQVVIYKNKLAATWTETNSYWSVQTFWGHGEIAS